MMRNICQVSDPDSRFIGLPLTVQYIDGQRWQLARDIAYNVADGKFKDHFSTVRAGFIFDFASIPRVFWRLFPPAGLTGNPYGIAALFHDWLYKHHFIQGIPCARSDADGLFYEIMIYVGCTRWSAWLMYRAVRAFGWVSWSRNAIPQGAV